MKKYIKSFIVIAAAAATLTGCDDNSWNDKLDGFSPVVPADAEAIEYTLSAADYKTLAGLSANKALAGDENAAALSAVGTQGYFTQTITPQEYIPAFLSQETFPYFALPNGSSVKVTYKYAAEMSPEMEGIANAESYTLDEADYQTVWGSETDYAESFAPSHTAAKSLPALLKSKFPAAAAGDYMIVTYNTSATDPVFGGGSTPEVPAFTPSSVLGSFAKGDALDINGVVMAVSTQGPIVADAAGSIFAYNPSNNADLKVGDQVSVSSTVSSYNYGYQLAAGAEAEVKGNQAVTYPTAKSWTGAEIDAYVAAAMATGADPVKPVYSKFTGTVAVSGNYINIILDGTTVQVSPYGASATLKSLLVDGSTVEFEGYVVAIASKGKYLNTIITKVGSTSIANLSAAKRRTIKSQTRAAQVASTVENVVYTFNGTTWAPAVNTVMLNPADYTAMGQNYGNLSGNLPATLLPTFLKQKYPYAVTDDALFVVYKYYDGSANSIRVTRCVYDGAEWTAEVGNVVTETSQFVKTNGKWQYSPDVNITLPAGKGIAISTLYYQTCVDWVAANVPDGAKYVSSYGNNEYYCGTSAYQGNVDLRPSAARTQYAEAYDGMTDDEIVAVEKQRFETEVFPAALAILHPDAAPVNGIEPLYTITFAYYTGTTQTAVIVYKVTGPAKFEFQSCTWND